MEYAKATLSCRLCGQRGSDVCITSCGCTLHAWCVPLDLLGNGGAEPEQPPSLPKLCPCCGSVLSRIEILEISSEMIDRVVELHRKTANAMNIGKIDSAVSETRSNQDQVTSIGKILPELKYLILSSSYNPMEEFLHSSLMSEADFHRLGRWTKEEVGFVDFICNAFEEGQLPIPNGISLKEFLCHILLCKGSRLTKRLKNAKLSVRTYEAKLQKSGERNRLDSARLGEFQERFFQSLNTEISRLETRFYNEKTWKSMFSNLCIQLDSQVVDASKWQASIEALDRKYASAAEIIRNKRRTSAGIAFSAKVQAKLKDTAETALAGTGAYLSSNTDIENIEEDDKQRQQSSTPSVGDTADQNNCISGVNEFTGVFDDSIERTHFIKRSDIRKGSNTLLTAIRSFVEKNNLPFHYFELWAPSAGPPNTEIIHSDISLYHAGFAFRGDLDSTTKQQVTEFGEYQGSIQIEPGSGLPGQALTSHKTQWEYTVGSSVDHGKKQSQDFGLNTTVAIPIIAQATNNVIVIVTLYSLNLVPEDFGMLNTITAELSRYTPKPKWRSIVEVGKPISSSKIDGAERRLVPGSTNSSYTDLAAEKVTIKSRTDSPPPPSIDAGTEQMDERAEEIYIANLLGSHMPNPLQRQPLNSNSPPIDCYISLRLLFLRSPSTRNDNENGIVEIIRQSYRAYCQCHKWTSQDIALLVVKDWMHLRDSMR